MPEKKCCSCKHWSICHIYHGIAPMSRLLNDKLKDGGPLGLQPFEEIMELIAHLCEEFEGGV